MPIYSYKCKACDFTVDFLESYEERKTKKCPKCKKKELVPAITAPAGLFTHGCSDAKK